ncbi:MAG: hypothetical protein RM368_30930 [Nostoc sp. DedSLP03]|uniref:hypothetical protein n=1 Tax=Nostoc sp. DedSLP03 TaxID=3075400 RepID=UPI002AD3C8F4|nr:hypothetical protein [Nostoc sp. DedSLP03]MDZ7969311.1 hypothetical protein [Nostoc sp. DedSLP03]
MANIKIAELSSLLEEVSATDLETVHGGVTPPATPGIQATGSTSGVGIGFSAGGSTGVSTNSFSNLNGTVGNFFVNFGTSTQGFTSPF